MIQVIQQGLLDTIQDAGRYGYQHLGINPGGVMDRVALSVVNSLVGNDMNTAVIEMHFPASAFLFERAALIALSGADFGAMVNDRPLEINRPVYISPQSILRFTKLIAGGRCYMAIQGGLELEPWLGSYSTHLKAGAGGFHGRRLQKLDRLFFKQLSPVMPASMHFKADIRGLYNNDGLVRVVAGTDWTEDLLKGSFALTERCDRMGFRLQGPTLSTGAEHISAGVTRGTVQLLPDGQLIILMADHQTTGGYGRVAHVITADQPSLAQRQCFDRLHFQLVSQSAALDLLAAQRRHLQILHNACKLQYD